MIRDHSDGINRPLMQRKINLQSQVAADDSGVPGPGESDSSRELPKQVVSRFLKIFFVDNITNIA